MQPGDRAGRYIIEDLLGAGGMGQVFRAYDDVLRRRVALKLLRPSGTEVDRDVTVRRTLREARNAAALVHVNVVAIHDVGEHEGAPFLVMELVEGRSVRSLIGSGAPAEERLRWLVDVARGLAAAHKAGLIHRDVKPENVIVREDGVVKVLDFGIARMGAVATRSSRPPPRRAAPPAGATPGATAGDAESTLAGTPAYMAPELVRGQTSDARVDQFAWGVMAFETLAGRLPWDPDPSSVLQSVLYQAAPPLNPDALGVARDVTLTIERALRKDPRERFGSMDEVLAALGAGRAPGESSRDVTRVASIPSASSPEMASAPTERATHSAGSLGAASAGVGRRRVSRNVAALALAVSAIALVAGTWVSWQRGARPRAAPASVLVTPSRAEHPVAFHPVEARRLTFDVGCGDFPSLTPDGKVVVFDETLGDDDHLVALDLATNERRLLTHERGWQMAADVSPDGTRVAYVAQDRDQWGAYVLPLDGSAAPRLVRKGGSRPTWTPDGASLWLGVDRALERVAVASGEVTRTIEAPPDRYLLRASELADGRVVALGLTHNNHTPIGFYLYAPPSDVPAPLVDGMDIEEAMAITRDGEDLLFTRTTTSGGYELWHAPLEGGTPAPLGYSEIKATKGLALAGDRIVWSTCRTEAIVSRLDPVAAGAVELRPDGLFPRTEWEDFAAVGIPRAPSKLVLLSDRAGKAQPWVVDLSNREPPRPIDIGAREAGDLAVAPDGRWLAFSGAGSGGVFVVPADGSAAPRRIAGGENDSWPSFAADGETLFYETDGASGKRAIVATSLTSNAPPSLVVDRARHPCASPVADLLAYVTQADGRGGGVPEILDRRTGKSAPVSPSIKPGNHPSAAWSPDGKRIAVQNGLQEVVEIELQRRTITGHFASGDDLGIVTYAGTSIVVVRNRWGGDLWTARDAR